MAKRKKSFMTGVQNQISRAAKAAATAAATAAAEAAMRTIMKSFGGSTKAIKRKKKKAAEPKPVVRKKHL
jgi:hypothetical protein